jgi:hypothetical protein
LLTLPVKVIAFGGRCGASSENVPLLKETQLAMMICSSNAMD